MWDPNKLLAKKINQYVRSIKFRFSHTVYKGLTQPTKPLSLQPKNVALRHNAGLTGQKMGLLLSDILWPVVAPYLWAPVQPNMLNMPKSTSAANH